MIAVIGFPLFSEKFSELHQMKCDGINWCWQQQHWCNDNIVWFCCTSERPHPHWHCPLEAGRQLFRCYHLARPSPNRHRLLSAMPTRNWQVSSSLFCCIRWQWGHQTHSCCKNLAEEPWNKEANMLRKQRRQQQQRKELTWQTRRCSPSVLVFFSALKPKNNNNI